MAATEGANYDVYVKSSAVDAHQLGSCPYCTYALLVLEEKGCSYTRHIVDMTNATKAKGEKPKWLLEVNPAGTVPVMKLPKEETSTLSKDKWLISSNDISDYLETKHSASGQAKLGKHADIPDIASKLMPCTGAFLKASGAEEAQKKEALQAQLTQLDSHLTSNGPFLAGSALSLGDLALAPKLYATQIVCKHFKNYDPLSGLKGASEWKQRMESRPSWEKTVTSPEAIIEGWKAYL